MNISTIRETLATRLSTVDGLRVHQTAPGQVVPPAAVVFYGSPFLTRDSRDTWTAEFVVRLLVSAAVTTAAQDNLDVYLGTGSGSVISALEADADITVVQVDEPGVITYSAVQYLAADLTVQVMAMDVD